MKSDTYSFGVVLLEVLCGRPAVESSAEEDERSLTTWARDKISKGEVDQIIAPTLRDEVSPASLKTFVRIAERCLHDEPKKRPAMAHVIINLEYALEQQENANSLVQDNMGGVADVLPFTGTAQPRNVNFLIPDEVEHGSVLPEQVNTQPLSPKEVENNADDMKFTVKFERAKAPSFFTTPITVGGTGQQIMTSPNMKNVTSPLKNAVKTTMRKLSRLWPQEAIRKSRKSSKRTDSIGSISAPLARRIVDTKSSLSQYRKGGEFPKLRVFSFAELKAITRNFRPDTILGEGGFGKVYKGLLKENGIEYTVAIKKLNPESFQGIEQWRSELYFLGILLSHPNLVKLVGYCMEDKQILLVYEFMSKGSLDNNLFQRNSVALPWDIRLKILIGAANGLAFLHALERPVICRDLKSSNILLDGSYNAKLADFGLAKWGPAAVQSHVSTRVIGTYGFIAPEYMATGQLYVKSDVYSFGVVLLEMMTGLRAVDSSRLEGQQNLVGWIKPLLSSRRHLYRYMDQRLEQNYPAEGAFQIAQLAKKCLENEPQNRPSSTEVVEALESIQPV